MVDSILLGYGEVANGTQPTLSEAYAPDLINTIYNYDVDKANSLLDAAGWVAGSDGVREKDGVKLSFEIMYGACLHQRSDRFGGARLLESGRRRRAADLGRFRHGARPCDH